jgi:hypothetical protein
MTMKTTKTGKRDSEKTGMDWDAMLAAEKKTEKVINAALKARKSTTKWNPIGPGGIEGEISKMKPGKPGKKLDMDKLFKLGYELKRAREARGECDSIVIDPKQFPAFRRLIEALSKPGPQRRKGRKGRIKVACFTWGKDGTPKFIGMK